MLFTFGDLHPSNFMIDTEGKTVVVDFACTSILPTSFVLSACYDAWRLPFYACIQNSIVVHGANPHNANVILEVEGRNVSTKGMGSKRVKDACYEHGGDEETQQRLQSLIRTSPVDLPVGLIW